MVLVSAGFCVGGEAAAERGRLPVEVGVRLLAEEEEELARSDTHSSHQTGEERRIHQQRRLRGVQTQDGEDADKEGESLTCFHPETWRENHSNCLNCQRVTLQTEV